MFRKAGRSGRTGGSRRRRLRAGNVQASKTRTYTRARRLAVETAQVSGRTGRDGSGGCGDPASAGRDITRDLIAGTGFLRETGQLSAAVHSAWLQAPYCGGVCWALGGVWGSRWFACWIGRSLSCGCRMNGMRAGRCRLRNLPNIPGWVTARISFRRQVIVMATSASPERATAGRRLLGRCVDRWWACLSDPGQRMRTTETCRCSPVFLMTSSRRLRRKTTTISLAVHAARIDCLSAIRLERGPGLSSLHSDEIPLPWIASTRWR